MVGVEDNPQLQHQNELYYQKIRPKLLKTHFGRWVLIQYGRVYKIAKSESGVLKLLVDMDKDDVPGIIIRHIGKEEEELRPHKMFCVSTGSSIEVANLWIYRVKIFSKQ